MRRKESNIRRIITVGAFLAVFLAFTADLVKIQLVDGDSYAAAISTITQKNVSIPAARGEIIDCNGNDIVINRQGYSIVFDAAFFPSTKEQAQRNEIILSLINMFESAGVEWSDTLPLVFDENGNIGFEPEREKDIAYMKSDILKLNEYATAQNCFDALIEKFELESYSELQAKKIASVCYQLKVIGFSIYTPFTFAEDVSEEMVAKVKENSVFYKGVDVAVVPYREYVDGTLAPHIVGRIGAIDAEEYSERKDEGYRITDTIGKSGIELAMEDYLHGVSGKKAVSTDADGNVTTSVAVAPQQGNTVVLTIDAGLQAVARDSLKKMLIDYKYENNSIVDAAGAVVVLDCNSGEVLACASYPTYDISTYSEKFKELNEMPGAPLWNRALLSTYATGSTMKLSVALAALEEETITRDTTHYCSVIFKYYEQEFKCNQYHKSRYINVISAIDESCNIFFYQVGKVLGIDKINEYRTLLGFGQKTGVEIAEATGVLDSPEYRESIGQSWLPGYTVAAAIGQGGNLISPIQLANYCATIANGGTRYRTHFVKSVMSYDMSEVIMSNTPEVVCETGLSAETIKTVKEGMYRVCDSGYCYECFKDLPVKLGAKTGTSQEYRMINGVSTKINNGFLVAFAPFENPEIAIAVVGEGFASGSSASPVVAAVVDYYFSGADASSQVVTENTLIG